MKQKAVVVLILLLVSMFSPIFIEVKAEPTAIYIRTDGSVDPPTAPIRRDGNTYTFTSNINGFIVVEKDNIVIDGAGYTLQGTGSENGITLSGRTNVTIRNTQIKNFYYGIYLDSSNNNTISGNNIANNRDGIWLISSSNNTIRWNTFTDCGLIVSGSYGNVVEDNTVNGKLLVYLEGVKNYVVRDAGQVILVNCDGIRVKNLNISRTSVGVELYDTSNSIISGNNIENNGIGIWLIYSSNNTISGNNITANKYNGIYLYSSSNNVISGNNITNNDVGIDLWLSNNNVISGNNIANNRDGIDLWPSNNNVISGNNIANNRDGIWLISSSNNTISGNNIENNGIGIYLYSSSNNVISGNNITNNWSGIRFQSFSNKIYHNNFINNSQQVDSYKSTNVWDNGSFSGGNYWSDYNGKDADGDGVGDTPYVIDEDNRDRYPLMKPWIITPTPSGAAGFSGSETIILAVAVVAILIVISVIILLTRKRKETQPNPSNFSTIDLHGKSLRYQ